MYKQGVVTVKGKVQKWGNSLGIRIPRPLAEETRLGAGSTVEISVEEGRLVIAASRDRTLTLRELLSKVTESNLHGGVDVGRAVGKEVR